MTTRAVDDGAKIRNSKQTPDYEPSSAYAWYVVIALTALFMLSYVDRTILSQLIGPIRRDLLVSDTQVGLLLGMGFTLFYTLMGLPLGRIADSKSRRNLIVVGVIVWSIFTSLSSVARTYRMLFAARVGVGVGEASLSPSAYSMISDYFPKERLGVAISVYYMGIYLGSGIALLMGGIIVDTLAHVPLVTLPLVGTISSWRVIFLIVGLPGVLFALLAYTIKEPLRKNLRALKGEQTELTFGEAAHEIQMRWKSVAGISFGMVFQSICTYALIFWLPTFFLRVHGWTAGQSGKVFATILATAGCFGMYAGGRISDSWFRRGVYDAALRLAVVSAIGTAIFLTPATVVSNVKWTVMLLAPGIFFVSLPMGVAAASLQRIFPNQVRAQVSALFLFVLSLGGLGLGPLMPGYLNDHLFHNGNMVGWSIAITIGTAAILMLIAFLSTCRAYREDYKLTNLN